MSRKVIEIVQVLVDRIEKNGYQQRCREDDIADVYKRLTDAEGQAKHWKQARQDAHEAGELMKAEIETLRQQLRTAAGRVDLTEETNRSLRQLLDAAHSDYALAQSGTLLHRLDMANATILAQKRGNQYLRLLIDKVRGIVGRDDAMSERLEQISQALDEFDHGTLEPTPVAEPLDAEGGA